MSHQKPLRPAPGGPLACPFCGAAIGPDWICTKCGTGIARGALDVGSDAGAWLAPLRLGEIDAALFSAWVRGDLDAEAVLWREVCSAYWTPLLRYMRALTGNDASAEAAAALVLEKLLAELKRKALTGEVEFRTLAEFAKYIKTLALWRAKDVARSLRTRREDRTIRGTASLHDPVSNGPGARSFLQTVPAAGLSPEELVQLKERIRAWCVFPALMRPHCGSALRAVLREMHGYTRQALIRAGAPLPGYGVPLERLAETADPLEVQLLRPELNQRLIDRLTVAPRRVKRGTRDGATAKRNAIDLRWRELKRIAAEHNIPLPPGLMESKKSRVARWRGRAA